MDAARRRYKYGFIVHTAITDYLAILKNQLEIALASWRDPEVPDLYKVEVSKQFTIFKEETPLFEVRRGENFDLSQGVFSSADMPGFSEALMYAVEYWNNGGSYFIAPEQYQISYNPPDLPNARQVKLTDGLSIFEYSNYPKKITREILSRHEKQIIYYPFEFYVTPPTRETEIGLMEAWLQKQEELLNLALEILRETQPKGWACAPPLYYRQTSFPDFDRLSFVGSEEAAEVWAQNYWHLCYLVNIESGKFVSRWASR